MHVYAGVKYTEGMEHLSDAPFTVVGMLISTCKYKALTEMGFTTYDLIYQSTVVSVMHYGSEVLGSSNIHERRSGAKTSRKSISGGA